MDAHNAYVLTAAECGVLGALVLVTLLIRILFMPWRLMWHADPQARTLGWSFFLATIGVILGNFYSSSLNFGEAIGDYWALAGITARAVFLWSYPSEPGPAVAAAPAAPPRRTL
jgi:O-antigen ligase